jgi:hypothetical protein
MKTYIKSILMVLVFNITSVTLYTLPVSASECQITASDNPNISYSINPNVTYKWNPDVIYSINPDVIFSINPNVIYKYNPHVTYSLNPDVTYSLNPTLGKWSGYHVCTPSGELIGASVIANEDVMILFTGKDWIGYFVTNKHDGYNFFNKNNEWKGFLVPTSSGGYAFFNREKKWVLSLTQ